MGGKSATTTQQVQIPPEVLERYNAVNQRAESAASQPFQAYSTDPNAFVAPLTATQQAGIASINQAAGMSQPYFQTAANMTTAGSQGVGPLTQDQIAYYQNPYTQSVVDATRAGLQQQQGQQQAQQQAEAIRAGAFGGDRAGIQRATLMGQQGLATAQAISPLYQQAYQQAVQTATGQQGVRAQDLQRLLTAGQQYGGLGAAAQQSALAGGQAQLAAGTAEQQTQQAGLQALYNQFLQERGYDFQTAQFLANIAMGTGALSGSTTTTTQPVPFMSDEREKTNIQSLGKGLYAYDYKDDVRRAEEEGRPMPPKRVGPMAQDIEERAPGLVGEVNGHKVVKGLSPESMGGAVLDLGPDQYRERFAPGGLVGSDDIRAILAAQQQAFGPFAQSGLYGGNPQQGGTGKPGYVPGSALPTPKLMTAGAAPRLPESTVSQGLGTAREFGITPSKMYEYGQAGLGKAREMTREGPSRAEPPAPSSQGAMAASAAMPSVEWNEEDRLRPGQAYGGLVGYADGGGVDKDDPMATYGAQGPGIGIPTEQPDIKPLEAAKPPSGQPKSVMSDVTDMAKVAASIFAMSDARMKDNIEQVGELYDGQPVYRYNMKGSPKTQLGLMAQDLEHNGHGDAVAGLGGVKMVDYKRATDVAAGLAPREGFQRGGMPDEDYAIRTIAAEASGKSPEEARAIAHVIENRRASGRWGETYGDVVRAPKQFEPWSNPESQNYPMRFSPDSPRYQMAREALAAARGGEDITGGAMNFYAPAAQAKLAATRGDRAAVPPWARGREYVDFGPTRIVRGVDDPRASGLMAYAGEQGQAPASAEINRVAGDPRGLGQARPPASEAAAPTPQERSALAGFLPVKFGTRTLANPKGEEFGGVGEFLTSRQFVQPLLEGIGAMASSQNLSGVGAALQGLGAASKAYTGLEKEMAGIKTQGEQARSTGAQADLASAQAQGAALKEFNGRVHILVRDSSGRPKWVEFFNDYGRNREAYKLYSPVPGEVVPVGPGATAETTSGTIRQGDVSPSAGAKTPDTTPSAAPVTEPAAAPTRGTDPFVLSEDLKKRAAAEARDMIGATDTTLTGRKDIVEEQNKQAQQARKERDLLIDIGVLGSTPGGFVSQGALNAYKVKLAKVANDVVGSILPAAGRNSRGEPIPATLFDPSDLSRFEAWDKKLRDLSAVAAKSGNFEADATLDRLRSMFPSPELSQPGFAENAAWVIVERQTAIERARFVNEYYNLIKKENPNRLPERFSPEILEEFDRRYGAVFDRQREGLKKMLSSASGPLDPETRKRMTDSNGKPMSWFTFLKQNASRLDPEFVKQIEKRFNAPGIMNYFQVGAP